MPMPRSGVEGPEYGGKPGLEIHIKLGCKI